MTTTARIILTASICGILAQSALAQTCSTMPAPTDTDTAIPEVQYDTWFQPFEDNPVDRLRYPTPIPPARQLFQPFDSLEGLAQNVKTSRVVATTRAVFALPLLTVRAGETIEMPFVQQTGPAITAQTLRIEFDPKIVQAIDARSADWSTAAINYNATPEKVIPESKFVAVQWDSSPWTNRGSLLRIRMRAVAPGETVVRAIYYDSADDRFNMVPALVRDGLIRVIP